MQRSRTTFFSFTQTGTCVGSLHDGLLVQHWALRQRQISSHACNRDPTEEEASYRITSSVPFQKNVMNLQSLATKNKSSSTCILSTMKHDIPQTAPRLSHCMPDCGYRERPRPTCHQICALGSQTRLSASCLLPGWKTGGRKSGEKLLDKGYKIYSQCSVYIITFIHS